MLTFHVWLYQLTGPVRREDFGDSFLFELRVGFVFFFVLSGYLIFKPFAAAALGRADSVATGPYFGRRVARIVPAYYLAVIGAYVLIETAGDAPGRRTIEPDQLLVFFVFLQNYFPATLLKLDAPMWTLVVEVAFYILVPLLAWLGLRRAGVRGQAIAIALLFLAGLGWNALTHVEGWGPVATHVLPAFLMYFALGMAVALAAVNGARVGRGATIALAVAGVLAIVANGWWHATDLSLSAWVETLRDLPAALGMTAILIATTLGTGTGMGWLGSRPLLWLGTISYGLYLWHVPLIVWLNGHGLLPGGVIGGLAVVLPAAIAFGAASYYLVERPLLRRARSHPAAH